MKEQDRPQHDSRREQPGTQQKSGEQGGTPPVEQSEGQGSRQGEQESNQLGDGRQGQPVGDDD